MAQEIKKTLIEEITEWIASLDQWEQYLAYRVLHKLTVGQTEISTAYQYFKEDNKLSPKSAGRTAITAPATKVGARVASDFILKEIKGITGVNALKDNQVIPISKNLSVIYGENGAGKSGYIRVMNNAFLSRGDKDIIPNIYASSPPATTSCTYAFEAGGTIYEKTYPNDAGCHEFTSYSVFDTRSIIAHLQEEDEIQFLPNGLDFFDGFSQAVTGVKQLLDKEIAQNNIENPFVIHFDNPINTGRLVHGLNPKSDIKVFEQLATITAEEKAQFIEKEREVLSLKQTNIEKKSKDLKALKNLLAKFKSTAEAINGYLSADALKKYQKQIETHDFNKELSTKEGIQQFNAEKLNEVGGKEWKQLLSSAKDFADVQGTEKTQYPGDGDICVLCQQPLSKEAKALFDAYWKYLSSNAEKELKKIIAEIEQITSSLNGLDTKILPEDSVLFIWLKENAKATLTAWTEQIASCEKQRQILIGVFKNKKVSADSKPVEINIKLVGDLDKTLDTSIVSLNEAEVNKRIKLLEAELSEYKDRQKLTPLIPKIREHIEKIKWASSANDKSFTTRKITAKQKDLFQKFVTHEYVRTLGSECLKLKSDFGISVNERSVKGSTVKKLLLEGKSPSSILSEGEQRAISLADFFAEAQMGNKNRGIVFDDPVNSLDHFRRQTIAERIAEESAKRQVIVFTHDITFLLALQSFSKEKGVDCLVTTIRKIIGTPGVVVNALPWIASNVSDRVSRLNVMMESLKKTEKSGDPDKYLEEAKTWSGMLRETWERSIEEKLFNGAIQRFSPGIETKRIEKMKFTPDLYKEIEKGMGDCSNWVHDQARALNTPTPDTATLQKYLDEFKAFVKKFN